MIDLDAFNRDLEAETRSLPEESVRTLQRAMGLEALRRVSDKTPVDTGRASGNWQVGISTPVTTQIDRIGAGAAFEAESPKLDSIPAFDVVFIGNNVDYIEVLENGGFEPPDPGESKDPRKGRTGRVLVKDGYSVQAPNGMVAITVEELQQIFI